MKKQLLILGITFLALGAWGRVWTAKDGRKTEAELLSYDSETGDLVFKRKDGKPFKLNQSALADKDIHYLKELEAKRQEERAKAGTVIQYTTDGPHALRYHCYYPQGYTQELELPLLILFSPGGTGRGILKHFKTVGDTHNLMVVGCDGFKNNMDEELGRKRFDEMLPHIEKTIPHKAHELYMGGMSGGAWRAYHYSAFYNDRSWRGILACGGWLGGAEYEGLDYRKKMAVAMVNGDADTGANGYLERDQSELKKRRCKTKVFDFKGGHVIAPPDVLNDAMGWILKNRAGP